MDDDLVDPEGRPPPPLTWSAAVDAATERLRALARPALGVAGVALAAIAAWALFLRQPAPPPIEASLPLAGTAPTSTSTSASTVPAALVAHAAGAVVAPGVHSVPAGARVADLLAAAGGPAPDADLDRVNLAAPVADGDRVWFPRQGEEAPPAIGPGVGGGAATSGSAADEPLDLNTASVEELDGLPGIGPTIAAAIVAHRERDGPFASVDELVDVRGIGDARLAELRDLVVVR